MSESGEAAAAAAEATSTSAVAPEEAEEEEMETAVVEAQLAEDARMSDEAAEADENEDEEKEEPGSTEPEEEEDVNKAKSATVDDDHEPRPEAAKAPSEAPAAAPAEAPVEAPAEAPAEIMEVTQTPAEAVSVSVALKTVSNLNTTTDDDDDDDKDDGRRMLGDIVMTPVGEKDSDSDSSDDNDVQDVMSSLAAALPQDGKADDVNMKNDGDSSSSSSDDFEEVEEVLEGIHTARPPRPRVNVEWQCLNLSCPSPRSMRTKERLTTAASYVIEYFGVRPDAKKKRKVCEACRQEADKCRRQMVDKLKRGENILPDATPLPGDLVTFDSDEDLVTDSSSSSEFDFELGPLTKDDRATSQDKVKNLLESVLTQFDVKKQVDTSLDVLDKRLKAHGEKFDQSDNIITDLENQIDTLRTDLYKKYRPTLEHLPPADLNQLEEEQERKNSSSSQRVGGGSPMVRLQQQATGRVGRLPFPQPPQQQQQQPNSDVSFERQVSLGPAPALPPLGELERPALAVGQAAYAMRGNILDVWKLGSVIEVNSETNGMGADPAGKENIYKLRFEVKANNGKLKTAQTKNLSRKHLAYSMPSAVRLSVGTRVIAVYRDENYPTSPGQVDFYSGIVAEPPKVMNKYRYLVFFDDGYASYIQHRDIRLVCYQGKDVWEDIHLNSREFIKKYLQQYPERPMVKLNVGQVVRTEWEGKWCMSRVIEVDASLVRLRFSTDNRTELVYRGSTRLGPLFMELQNQRARKDAATVGGAGASARRHTNMPRGGPYVEYTRQLDPTAEDENSRVGSDGQPVRRAVARKSTGGRRAEFEQQQQQPAVQKIAWESKGEIKRAEIEQAEGKKFVKHQCGAKCLDDPKYQYKPELMKNIGTLLIPIKLGWVRQLTKHKNLGKRTIFYVAPCGRRLKSLDEIHRYLRVTHSALEIDFFNFDWYVHVYNEFRPTRELCKIPDVSYGRENIPVSCVNSLDNNYPEYVEYSRVRLPQKNVNINTDEDFLTCCDCTDDCQNKDKCACWQLTIKNTDSSPDSRVNPNVGYSFRRLTEVVTTGIYECNSRCKCNKTCLNRVAQNPLRCRLQVFKTEKRGWGIRTLTDIPAGGFICIYVGHLYSNEEANSHGQAYGDEYFAELDMIETVEKQKEGYESDIEEDEDDDDGPSGRMISPVNMSDDNPDDPATEDEEDSKITRREKLLDREDFSVNFGNVAPTSQATDRQTRSRNKTGKKVGDSGSDDGGSDEGASRRPVRGFGPKLSGDAGDPSPGKKKKADEQRHTSARKFFGKDEDVYIMDAKSIGNIGRYLNHSCMPNVFVQNCFVDTHDLRFPWISFFASMYIRAGQELCWDYCYVVDQVKGKEIYCQCQADQCRGRLL